MKFPSVFLLILLLIIDFYSGFSKTQFTGIGSEATIIHANNAVTKRADGQYFVSGDLIIKIWDYTYYCDSALLLDNGRELDLYGIKKKEPPPKIFLPGIDGCPHVKFFLKICIEMGTCPAY